MGDRCCRTKQRQFDSGKHACPLVCPPMKCKSQCALFQSLWCVRSKCCRTMWQLQTASLQCCSDSLIMAVICADEAFDMRYVIDTCTFWQVERICSPRKHIYNNWHENQRTFSGFGAMQPNSNSLQRNLFCRYAHKYIYININIRIYQIN